MGSLAYYIRSASTLEPSLHGSPMALFLGSLQTRCFVMKRMLEYGFWWRSRGLTLLFCWGAFVSQAQNLVPNPSFEEYTVCPNDLSQIDGVLGWVNIGISPDYFNLCADDSVSVPLNALGDEWPADGNGYAGLGIGPPTWGKEYMQAELNLPLDIGVPTHVSMRVSPGGFGIPFWTTPMYGGSHVGLRLSTLALNHFTVSGQFEFNSAVLYMEEVLSDTSGWTVLATSFLPDSAYRFMQIGNFFSEAACSIELLDPFGDVEAAYAFIDMVCVSQQPDVCDQPTAIHSAGETGAPPLLVFTNRLDIDLSRYGLEGGLLEGAVLFDALGKIVARTSLYSSSGLVTIAPDGLPIGHYCLVISQRDGQQLILRCWKSSP
jgi:hypothetical protein